MINLLPPRIKETRTYGRRNISLFRYSVALLFTAAVTVSIMAASLSLVGSEEPDLQRQLEANQTTVTALEKEIKTVENVANRLDTAVKIEEQSVSFSELIPKIAAVLPDGVILNGLSLTGGKTDPLQLDVDMKDAALGPILIRTLVDSDLFEAADIASLSPKGTTGDDESEAYQFTASISASFTGTAEAAKKAAAAEAAKKKAAEAQQAGSGGSQ